MSFKKEEIFLWQDDIYYLYLKQTNCTRFSFYSICLGIGIFYFSIRANVYILLYTKLTVLLRKCGWLADVRIAKSSFHPVTLVVLYKCTYTDHGSIAQRSSRLVNFVILLVYLLPWGSTTLRSRAPHILPQWISRMLTLMSADELKA